MSCLKELIESTKQIVLEVANEVLYHKDSSALKAYTFDNSLSREIKAFVDQFIESRLISALKKYNFPILSEERGVVGQTENSDYIFIIDPLDGTFNFVRNFGSYCISVALWFKGEPIFGVIYDLSQKQLYWGGRDFGSFCDNVEIQVSSLSEIDKSLICSGFPVRYDMSNLNTDNYIKVLSKFAKVRMIGSAAMSVINVAKGLAEAYFEKNIMIWDVAAGIAIAEGAGGSCVFVEKSTIHTLDVIVTNNHLIEDIKVLINER